MSASKELPKKGRFGNRYVVLAIGVVLGAVAFVFSLDSQDIYAALPVGCIVNRYVIFVDVGAAFTYFLSVLSRKMTKKQSPAYEWIETLVSSFLAAHVILSAVAYPVIAAAFQTPLPNCYKLEIPPSMWPSQ